MLPPLTPDGASRGQRRGKSLGFLEERGLLACL